MIITTRPGGALFALCLLTLAVACGDDDATSSSTASPSPSATPDVSALPIPAPWELHVAATDGSGDHLVYSSESYGQYAWAPDGKRVAISDSGGTETTTVRIVSLDGAETGSFAHAGYPNKMIWSPDGRFVIAAFSENSSTDSLIAVDPESGEQRELLRSPNNTYSYLLGWFSGAELRLIQATNATQNGKLLAINVGTGASRQLSDLTVVPNYYSDGAVSPDGKQIAIFASVSSDACPSTDYSAAVFAIDIETGASAQVTQDVYCSAGDLIWSADGKQIAYLTFDLGGGTATLSAVDVSSHQARALTSGLNEPVAWLADGTILANKLFCTGCDGGGPPRVLAINSETGQTDELTGSVPSAVSISGRIAAADGALKEINARGEPIATLAQFESNWQYSSMTWSRDEKYVAYGRFRGQGEHYFEVNADGSGYGWIGSYDGSTKLSADRTRIAYLTFEPLDTGKMRGILWLADSDASNATQVEIEGSVGAFSWSPDAARILFSAFAHPGEPGAMYLVSADGSGLHAIAANGLFVEAKSGPPAWSPNGKLVTFLSAGPTIVLDVDTGRVTEVGPSTGKAFPRWSADSAHLLFSDGTENSIEVVAIDGSGTTRVTPGGDRLIGAAAQSPDGERIAYWSALPTSSFSEIHVVNSDGSGDVRVLEGPNLGGTPVWSPDGRWFAIDASDGDRSGLFAISADGTQTTQMTRGGPIDSITWLDNDTIRFSTFIGGL